DSMLGHRGLTHSLLFAALAAALVGWHFRTVAPSHAPSHPRTSAPPDAPSHLRTLAPWHLFLWFFAVTASHGILDACTDGGRGIAFFAPFSAHRYFFPWRPIQVSPIGAGFFSSRGLRVLVSESGWIWLPSAIIAVSARIRR